MLLFLSQLGFVSSLQAEESVPSIPFETYKLNNGLNVILSEDKSVPFVQVNIWYNVGSKDETKGLSGFAHLFEHLMFQGSEHYDQEYFAALEEIGASVNGTTSFDRTNYFEGVPAEQLPLALWIESDRMGWLLPALTEEKLTNQQEVVRNERRQRYEVTPFGEVWVWLFENLYPEGHPYNIPTIGTHEDIENAQMSDVKAFFEKWYVPSNASLVVCGDFESQEAKVLIEKYFGEVPAGEPVSPLRAMEFQTLSESKNVVKESNVPFSKVWVAWPTPALYQHGDAELDILSTLLTDGKDSLLYRSLIETGLAKDVQAFQYSTVLQSQYFIEITPVGQHSTDELVAKLDESLNAFDAEESVVQMAKNSWETHFYENLESISNKADMLNGYYINAGDPGFISQDIERYQNVSAQSIQETFSQYILNQNRVVLHVHPAKKESEQ